ncbi:MAG: hypothetical protein LC749_10210, partial [Actinobacteria bacterium]|nr:hypothetical protein [Actinomycetota bacterium]
TDLSAEQAKKGWLTFLRFDQLSRLREKDYPNEQALHCELVRLGEEMFPDWALVDEVKEEVLEAVESDPRLKWMLEAYRSEAKNQRVDPGRLRLVRIPEDADLPNWLTGYERDGFAEWKGDEVPDGILDGTGELLIV